MIFDDGSLEVDLGKSYSETIIKEESSKTMTPFLMISLW